MPVKKVIQLLADNNARYTLTTHSPAHTASEVAQRTHTPGKNMAKVVALKVDSEFAILMLPSHYHVLCDALRDEIGAQKVTIANEAEFESIFGGCEVGAIPPFGVLWKMQLYMSSSFNPDEDITFNAGSWSEVITMSCHRQFAI